MQHTHTHTDCIVATDASTERTIDTVHIELCLFNQRMNNKIGKER